MFPLWWSVCRKKIPFWQYVILQLELWHPKLSWYQNLLINIFLPKIGRYCRLLMCRLWCQSDSWQTDFFSSLTKMEKKGGAIFYLVVSVSISNTIGLLLVESFSNFFKTPSKVFLSRTYFVLISECFVFFRSLC